MLDWYSSDGKNRVYVPKEGKRLVVCGWRVRRKEWYVMAVFQYKTTREVIDCFNTLTCATGIWD